ncbi:MAG: hypothetical protein IRZ29_09085, partial [Thermoflavifilum sp.]|nr:hypothetical protein [Thermoflavifilum sp.]
MSKNRLKSEQLSASPAAADAKKEAAGKKHTRTQPKTEKSTPKSSTQTTSPKSNHSPKRNHKLVAIFSWLISIFLFIAFTSYLFTWKEDQDKIFSLSYHILFNNEVTVENLLGRLGAYISHFF